MKLKKIISVALSVMMLAQSTTLVLADNNHWAQKSIDRMTSLKIVEGNEMGDFMPDNNITRAELFTILNRLTKISAISGNQIPDVAANAWYKEETDKAVTDGYVAGYDDGTIRPENNITRAEAATLISRIFGVNEFDASSFTDGASIGSWAKDGIDALASIGVISGYDDGSFRPNDNVTRAEVVTMLDKLIGHIKNDRDSKELYGKTVEGNLIVTSGRFVLENVTVNGNIYITNGATNDEVRLVNCKVTGDIFYGNNNTRAVVLEDTTANAVTAGGNGAEIVLVGKTELSKIYSNGAKISGPDYEGEAIGEIIAKGDTIIGVDASKVTVEETSLVTVKDDARVSKLSVKSSARNSEIKSTDGSIGGFETEAVCTLNGSSVKPGYSTNNVGSGSSAESENYTPSQSGGSTGGGGGGGGGGGASGPSSGAAPGVTTPYEITSMGVNVTRKESGDFAGPALVTYDRDTAFYNINIDYDDVDVKFDIAFTTGSTVKLNGIQLTSGTPYTMTNLTSGKTVVDILVFNGIQQKYAYKVTITKGAPAPAGTVEALNSVLSGLANASAAEADAISVLQAFKNAELDTAKIGLVGAYKDAFDAAGGTMTQRQFIDMVADVNANETPDNSAVLSAVASVSDTTIKTLSISDGTPSYIYTGTLDSASVANLDGAVDFYINVPSEGTYTIATIGSSVNGDTATVTVNDANTPLATTDLNPSHDDATAEEVAHGTVTLPAGLNKITVESTSQSADSKITGLLIAGEDSVYPPVGVVAIRLSADSTVRHLNTSRTNTPYVGGEYNVNADAWKATYDGQSCYRIQLTNPLTTYVYAPVAGNYTMYTIGSRSQWGPVNGTALINGTTTVTGVIAQAANDNDPERHQWQTITLNEGYNTITFNTNQNNHRLVGLDIAGPEVRVGINSVATEGATFTPAFDEATTEYSTSIDYDVNDITFTVDFTRFSKVKINSSAVTSGTPVTISVPEGNSTVTMVLYDETDAEVETYNFNITKAYASPAGTIDALNDVLADTYATPIDIMQAIANAKLVGAEIEQAVNYQAAYAAAENKPLDQRELQAGITVVNDTATPDESSVLPYVLTVNADSNMTTASVASATPSYVYYGSGTSLTEKALDDKIEFYVNAETAGTYTLFANAKTLSDSSKLTISVNGGAATQLGLTTSYIDNEIYAGTLNQGLNKITLSSSDGASNVTIKSLKVLGSNVIFIPAGVTPKAVTDTEVTSINFNTDACYAGGAGNEVAAFNGTDYEFVGVVPTVTVYLDVAAAGTYKLAAISKRGQYGSNSTTFTVTDSQGNANTVSGKISDDTIGTPAQVTIGEITLAAGTNTIKISSTTNNDKVGGLMLVPDGVQWPPMGVTPMQLSANGTVEYYATTTAPKVYDLYDGTANTAWLASYNGMSLIRLRFGSSQKIDLWVYAPEAGSYNLGVLHARQLYGYPNILGLSVNGTTVKAVGSFTYADMATATDWSMELKDWGNVTLNAGYNCITFNGNNNHTFGGFVITGLN